MDFIILCNSYNEGQPSQVIQTKKVLDGIKHPSSGASFSIPIAHTPTTLPNVILRKRNHVS
jgi:hypothetical protein